jgi:predicted outer membrane repeat protein
MKRCVMLTVFALAATALPACATTHRVDVGGGGDFTTIWSAVVAAAEGDTILVAPGTYTGAANLGIDPSGVNIVFLAEDPGRTPTIIDGTGGEAGVFYFHTGEDATTLVHGFTIQNADNSSNGGAITASNASPTIEECTFLNCTSSNGGAMYFYLSESEVRDCVFRGNVADNRGGAIYTYNAGPTFTGCLFDENMVTSDTYGGGALYLNSGSEEVSLCTFVENDLNQVKIYYGGPDVRIANCVIANGTAGVSVANEGGTGLVTRCVLFGNPGGDTPECDELDNIYQDPRFCDDLADDYTLCDNSSAVWNNNLWGEQIGAFGSGCPECGTPVEDATWGAVKALFR